MKVGTNAEVMTVNVISRCGCESTGLSTTEQSAQTSHLLCSKGNLNAGIQAAKYHGDDCSRRFWKKQRR